MLLIIVIFLAFISLGLPDSILGVAWPELHKSLSVPSSYAGLLSTSVTVCTIISALLYPKISKKLSAWKITVISILMTSISLFGYSIVNKFYFLFPFAIVLGLGAGAIDSTLNNYVAINFKSSVMSYLHASWGIGTIVAPLLLSYLFNIGTSWRVGYRIIALIQLLIFLIVFISYPLWKKKNYIGQDKEVKSFKYSEIVKKKGVFPALFGFFAYCSMESSVIVWSASYGVSLGLSEAKSSSSVAFFYIGITTGRVLSGIFSSLLDDRKTIRIALFITTLGIISLFIIPNYLLFLALLLLGIGFGPLFPSMIHQTPYLYGKDESNTLIGLEMASAYIGSALMPLLFGFITPYLGLGFFKYYIFIFFLIALFSTEKKGRIYSTI